MTYLAALKFNQKKSIVLRHDYEINSCIENYPIKSRRFAACFFLGQTTKNMSGLDLFRAPRRDFFFRKCQNVGSY